MTVADAVPERSRGGAWGCVVRVEVGVAIVLTDDGEVRASYGARLLGELARDRGCAPEPGDWVQLRLWPDDRVTVDRVADRRRLARVVPLRPR